jgi:hypothetical protein
VRGRGEILRTAAGRGRRGPIADHPLAGEGSAYRARVRGRGEILRTAAG